MNYKSIFKELINDFQNEKKVISFTQREGTWSILQHKATVLIGVRRSGKSTLLLQMGQEWQKKHKSDNWHRINFLDERLLGIKAQELGVLLEAIEEWQVEHGEKEHAPLLLQFDEIQEVEKWEYFADRVLRRKNTDLIITGSSAKMLSREIATQMRGRTLALELFPMSLTEAATHLQTTLSWSTAREKAKSSLFLKNYLAWGGFPEVLSLKRPDLKRAVLQNYFEVLLLRDVVERNKFSNIASIRQSQRILFSQFAGLFSGKRLAERLSSTGFKFNKNIIPEILSAFEDAFALFFVPFDTTSQHKQQIHPKKLYLIDLGFAQILGHSFKQNQGRFLENAVYLELRRKTPNIFYGKSKDGGEVDFVVYSENEKSKKPKLVQVAWSIKNSETRDREVLPLRDLMKQHGVKKATIVTFDEEEEILVPEGKIEVIPFVVFQSLS